MYTDSTYSHANNGGDGYNRSRRNQEVICAYPSHECETRDKAKDNNDRGHQHYYCCYNHNSISPVCIVLQSSVSQDFLFSISSGPTCTPSAVPNGDVPIGEGTVDAYVALTVDIRLS